MRRHLVDRAGRSDAMDVLGRAGGLCLRLALRHEHQQAAAAHDVVDDADGGRILHQERARP